MNATTAKAVIPTEPGTPFEGGFYVGRFRLDGSVFASIVSTIEGDLQGSWIHDYLDVPEACSFNDGLANTKAMVAAGSELAARIQSLRIGGFEDWFMPSRDELELAYRHLKPTTAANYVYRAGDNPSAIPSGYPYTTDSPAQTSAAAFMKGGEHALQTKVYFSSTQSSRNYAWSQSFVDGYQYDYGKTAQLRARAFRRFKVE